MNERLQLVREYVQAQLASDHTGHDFAHIQRVVKLTQTLLRTESADATLALTIAYLHDVPDEKLTDNPKQKRQEIATKLAEWGYSAAAIRLIMYDIAHLSFSTNLQHHYELDPAGQLAQDADRLDAIGLVAIARTFAYGAVHGIPLYEAHADASELTSKSAYRHPTDTFHHYQARTQRVMQQLNTTTAQQLAQPRLAATQRFLDQFLTEWQGKR
ncbi:HD domain-containing protein [Fructilactobacillus cliffordii]|uniref:HD domain-containing protein n=1 Tax=Fructilactobacillus cliffordii TaxID=2940299 RepID=A0A9Q8ZTN5_9LACO|nr:HD domain-containing protein [Fructilactobacillus cliffordii]USS89133.1 HD domain-containing protein [Fructilactobacillus cliffordii]